MKQIAWALAFISTSAIACEPVLQVNGNPIKNERGEIWCVGTFINFSSDNSNNNSVSDTGANSSGGSVQGGGGSSPSAGGSPSTGGSPSVGGKGNASANNGKGGNYDRTGHSDNGKGNGRNR